jgi:hypothetical protein
MQDITTHLGILYAEVYMPGCQSLKQKRMVIKSLKNKVKNRYNVSVAELDRADKWQRAMIGFAMIGNDQRYIDGALQKIITMIEGFHAASIIDYWIEW